ncbi:methyltransferase domain-containing protein [Pseudomonas sp. L-22-4S-12]|uniref:class I SAM-dependent methyltransferase n=1 Tax=Pseudomonas sp. L-22-4S-12 TaxID=2610893 RepID=UPI0013238D41|nr:class I SAM-dependent methyltransferase [Pseudomonas sp. L-22-4S-12]MWV15683.1 methyltransferase domain-containing protein [Pseudomonas sp. L-22-4S-12]
MSEVARLFGARADAYASFRPHYPTALFDWLAANSPGHARALDIACGSGQASCPLRRHFRQVLACDGSVEQLRAATDLHGIACFAASAEAQPLAAASIDLIVVAQALHWFATPAFFAEVRRLLKPDGLFCAWCYGLLRIDSQLDAVLDDFYQRTLGPYWPPGRASVDAGYRDIQAPFPRLQPPPCAIELQWDLPQLLGYLGTWSAVQRLQQASGRDPLRDLRPRLEEIWADPGQRRFVRWPLHFLAGLPNNTHQ